MREMLGRHTLTCMNSNTLIHVYKSTDQPHNQQWGTVDAEVNVPSAES